MSFVEMLIFGIGLSMDAFAVAVCTGLALKHTRLKDMLIVGLYFGGFQALMTLLGYLAGSQFAKYIEAFDHWIAFGLLVLIGAKMIKESFDAEGEAAIVTVGWRRMLPLAIATSIDALAVGISFAFLRVNIAQASTVIGVTTFVLSMLGVGLGHWVGGKFRKMAEIAGGAILILMGVKILLEHLGVL